MRHVVRLASLAVALTAVLLAVPGVRAEEPRGGPARIVPRPWLLLPPLDPAGRAPLLPNAVFERHLLRPDAPPPREGDVLRGSAGGESAWRTAVANERGDVAAGGFASAFAAVEVGEAGVWLAEIHRVSTLYVNGVPHAGDVYGHGIVRTPVHLVRGTNRLFAAGLRGPFRIVLEPPPAPVFLAPWDATLPDVVPGERVRPAAGVLLVNARDTPLEGALVTARFVFGGEGLTPPEAVRVVESVDLPPLGSVKLAIREVPVRLPPDATHGFLGVRVTLGGEVLDERSFALETRPPGEPYRRTFPSAVDGSIQFFALRKPAGPAREGQRVVLTLHGASVDALSQARAYSTHEDFWIVAPTNRRPYGFDWQDWGRRDAYEALDDVCRLDGLPSRPHLTGHSMGGHGTWHLAVNDPDRFLSIAPSAGWVSFDTYGSRPRGVLARLWHAADGASLTAELAQNLRDVPTYVLHGTRDNNVPVTEARRMVGLLKNVATDLQVHYAEGEGHWWDGDAAPGADCVDWPGIFALFARTARRPLDPGEVDWTTADPGTDAEHGPFRIEQPLQYGAPSRIRSSRTEGSPPTLSIRTENVRRLRVSVPPSPRALRVVVDDVEVAADPVGDVACLREPQGWRVATLPIPEDEKRADRMGPFKRAFDRGFVLVHGTAGTPEENAAALQSARLAAEQWRYRANGRALCLSDRQYLMRAPGLRGRNVILYGNADTNAAWQAVFPDDLPVVPRRGSVTAGVKVWEGEDLGVLLVYPKRADDQALAAAVAGSGIPGQRLTWGVPYFLSGVGIPDFLVFGSESLRRGDEGVRAAGFFDVRWQLAD